MALDGSRFIGEWHFGVRKGQGKMEYSNGDSYQGSWNMDRMDGEGELRCSGMHYIGMLDRILETVKDNEMAQVHLKRTYFMGRGF